MASNVGFGAGLACDSVLADAGCEQQSQTCYVNPTGHAVRFTAEALGEALPQTRDQTRHIRAGRRWLAMAATPPVICCGLASAHNQPVLHSIGEGGGGASRGAGPGLWERRKSKRPYSKLVWDAARPGAPKRRATGPECDGRVAEDALPLACGNRGRPEATARISLA